MHVWTLAKLARTDVPHSAFTYPNLITAGLAMCLIEILTEFETVSFKYRILGLHNLTRSRDRNQPDHRLLCLCWRKTRKKQ